MALPISIPYTFANATTSIPLSQLDTDISTIYATVNGIGNGTVALANVVITGGIISNVSGISTSSIANGTSNVSIATANGSVVVSTAGNTAITVDTSQNITTVGTVAMASSFKRNRIINGNMLIDQRNAGASITGNSGAYPVDRWQTYATQSSKLTCQQSTTAPSGFKNSVLYTSSSAYSVAASDYFSVSQRIEGYNVADLNFGTASAATITLSFWVRCSLTGTFGGACHNNAFNRAYPFTYTISAANTWEQKTITIAGDTTGTWTTDNSVGLEAGFSLGCGSTGLGTPGAWTATSNIYGATGQVNLVGTSGATFYITGVQLEVGTKATPYEMQIYSDQISQCYRYCFVAPANWFYAYGGSGSALVNFATTGYFPVPMRTTPTATGTIAISNCPTPSAPVLSAYMVSYNSYNATTGAAAFGSAANYTFAAEL